MVVAVIGIIMYDAIKAGLPGISSGEMPLWRLKVSLRAYDSPEPQNLI